VRNLLVFLVYFLVVMSFASELKRNFDSDGLDQEAPFITCRSAWIHVSSWEG